MAAYRLRAIESPANTSRCPASCFPAVVRVSRWAPQAAASFEKRQCLCGVSPHVAYCCWVASSHLQGLMQSNQTARLLHP